MSRWTRDNALLIEILVVVFAFVCIQQYLRLQRAHRTLSNYEAFRGCTQVLTESDTKATCTISSGKTITIIKVNNKWYLEGDGPGMW